MAKTKKITEAQVDEVLCGMDFGRVRLTLKDMIWEKAPSLEELIATARYLLNRIARGDSTWIETGYFSVRLSGGELTLSFVPLQSEVFVI